MTDKTFPQQQYFSAEDCRTLYPPGTPYGNDHPNGWQDMADRLNALLANRLQASAVVVPERGLLPCPFCGGSPVSQPWHGGGPRKTMVCCENEECHSSPSVTEETPEEASRNWNMRADLRIIPADRVPWDRMVTVDRERLCEWADQWEETHLKSIGNTLAKRVCDRGLDAIRRAHHAMDQPCETCSRIAALRANQGGAANGS